MGVKRAQQKQTPQNSNPTRILPFFSPAFWKNHPFPKPKKSNGFLEGFFWCKNQDFPESRRCLRIDSDPKESMIKGAPKKVEKRFFWGDFISGKLTWHWKITIFNRRYIFKWLVVFKHFLFSPRNLGKTFPIWLICFRWGWNCQRATPKTVLWGVKFHMAAIDISRIPGTWATNLLDDGGAL